MELYRKYQIEIKARDMILGGIPKSADLIKAWLEARGITEESTIEKTKEEMDAENADTEMGAWTGFKSDENGIYIEARYLKAMIRECIVVMKLAKKSPGLKQLLQHGVFVKPDKLYLDMQEPEDSIEICAHVMGPKGPRSILKRHDFVKNVTLKFELWILNTHAAHKKLFCREYLDMIFEHGQELGLGCSRSQGYGKFDLISIEEI